MLHAPVLRPGDLVHVHVTGTSPPSFSNGRLVGFYCNEPRRIIVALPSGQELVAAESDVSLA
jgi:hypothetical protein